MADGFGFEGKVVLVTGAARGIGAAITRVFAAAGDTVVATDVLESELAATVKDVGQKARARRLDVTDATAWSKVVEEITAQHGRLDVLVNNAGILAFGDLQSTTADQFRRLFEVNVVGVFLGMQAVFPVMKAAARGAIVNMSSSSGLMATTRSAPMARPSGRCAASRAAPRSSTGPTGCASTVRTPTASTPGCRTKGARARA